MPVLLFLSFFLLLKNILRFDRIPDESAKQPAAQAKEMIRFMSAKPLQAEAERLVDTYSDMILRLCYTYLKNTQDAEDICQDVFLKLLTGNQTFSSAEHEKAWVLRTASNACKDLLKSAARKRTCPLDRF